ncbi:AAA family ATPase [Rhizobium sp. 268]|uniref:ATP-binding protein n=1 Tax=Rhizobium sp. 268 TaxID=2996375 RepID=UPI002F9524FB
MTQRVIAFVGISGVGKSTFLRAAAKLITFQHLVAGSLIGTARETEHEHDRLRLQNIDQNQQLLVKGFHLKKDAGSRLVVLDGHAIIDGAEGVQTVSEQVFASVGTDAIVHLAADPRQILANRKGDRSRDRPTLSVNELAAHQARSLAAAIDIGRSLSIPFRLFSHMDVSGFCAFAASL